ncbi:PAQR family membrane homeostasis protein TrhA [Cetobacterium sp. SF1]|uniref:PAQR family membrane homeostasis protein TrhA n=1 Tax=unclassified Cetobacterium TaxID=2630983 RepID=UPI003CF64807
MRYDKIEEYVNSFTHYFGAGLSIIGLIVLVKKAMETRSVANIAGALVFSLAMILLYTMSGTYHILKQGKIKNIFRVLDHSAIYILISASYTPYLLTAMDGVSRWVIFGIQWGMTLLGIIFKIFFTGRFGALSTIIYLVMGWMVVFVFKDLKEVLSNLSMGYLVAGGILYSLGVIFYASKKIKFSHAIWHLFVIGGSFCNYMSVYYLV